MEDASPQLEGRRIAGRYTLGPQIGAGGMGTVYRATQDVVGRDVAIKVLSAPGSAGYEALRQRFHREAKSIARLSGRRTVVLHDSGEEPDGLLYIVMELVPGATLKAELKRLGRLPPTRALLVATQVLEALDEAHRQGIVHRDVKPSNVMTELDAEGIDHVKVLDFGIAKLFGVDERDALTASSETPGTARYMAPEQIRGGDVSPATDVYAVGCLLYEMLSGEAPFSGETRFEVQMRHISAAVPPLPEGVAPPGVWPILLRALAKAPAERYGDAASMRRALRVVLGGPNDEASAPNGTPPPQVPDGAVASAAEPSVAPATAPDHTLTAGGEADLRRSGPADPPQVSPHPGPVEVPAPPAPVAGPSAGSGLGRWSLIALAGAVVVLSIARLADLGASPAAVAEPRPLAVPATQPPTQPPTQAPTQAPTQPPTQPPTQAPTAAPSRPRPATPRPSQPPAEAPLHFEVPHTLQD